MGANAAPGDVRLTFALSWAVGERRSPVTGVGHFPDVADSLDALDAQLWREVRRILTQRSDELPPSRSEPLTLLS